MAPELLTKIGEYEVKEKLGQGGYGQVYKARDQLGRDVAIKILTGFGDDSSTINAFKKEASTLAKLQHPNIVTVYQFDVDSNGRPYLVMEYVQGQPLSVIIRMRRELHLVEKLDIIIQATEGLRYAHEKGVIHRDIKPHNLMVVESPEKSLVVKLIDFGIAQGEASKSQSQSIAGSLPYMSPEHFVQRRTPWCDVFSMGVVLYELLTGGSVPYASDRDELPVAYGKLMSGDPAPPISQLVSNLPPGLEEVVAKAITKQKLSGYETAEEFLFELSRIQDLVKAEFVSERLVDVDAAIRNQDPALAYELVGRILRVDGKNPAANRKKFELKKLIEEARRNQQVRAICVRVESAIQDRQFEDAQKGLEEARQIDPGSPTVGQLQQKLADIRRVQERINFLVRSAEAHGKSGRWQEASSAIREAAALDRSNTQVLKFQAEIERRIAREHGLIEQARSLLHEQRFREASGVIRELEAMAPQSERVVALKELAVSEHREYMRRTEVAACVSEAQGLVSQGDLGQARIRLDEGIAKYPDERSLLDLRASVEQQQEELARRQFVQEKLRAGEQAMKAKNYIDAIALLEQARLRVPDPALEDLLAKAKAKAKEQAAEKRRDQYLKSAKESLAREDAASAVVTLEMAQSEFGATDTVIQSMLDEARSTAERQTREADERRRLEAERQARETAEREEIIATVTKAWSGAHEGDFNSGLKLIEQAAGKFGMRRELSTAANEIKAARTGEATASIEAIIQHANKEAEGHHYPLALEALQRGKAFAEFASQTASAQLRAAEKRIRTAAQDFEAKLRQAAQEEEDKRRKLEESQNSATQILSNPSLDSPTIRQNDAEAQTIRQDTPRAIRREDDDSNTVVMPSTGSRGAAAAAARAPVPEEQVEERSAQRPVLEPVAEPAAPSSKKWIAIAAGAALFALALIGYLVFGTSSAIDVRFDTDPSGAQVAVNGQNCSAPCGLKLKPGHYTVKATHDQYSPLDQPIDVTDKTSATPIKLALNPLVAAPPAVGTLSLDINVEGADIFVDNQLKDTARGRKDNISVAAGSHQVRVEKQGYQPNTKSVDIAKDSQASLAFTLVKGQDMNAYVNIKSVPNAKVMIDRQFAGNVGTNRKFSAPVEPGKSHVLDLSLDGYESESRTVTAKAGERVSVSLELKAIAKPVPSVVSFAADAAEIQAGKSTTLKWETKDASEVSIEGLGTFPASGSKQVTPTANTTYALTATGPGGKSTAKTVAIRVTTTPPPPPPPGKPVITRFEFGQDTIREGEKAKLMWDTQNADSVTIDHEVGTQKASGSVTVNPNKTTSYTLTAKGPGGTVTSQPQTLTVEAKAAPAPTTPTAPPAPSAGPDDAQLIKQLLEQRWKSAFESGSDSDLQKIFPNIPGTTLTAIKGAQARHMRLSLNCSPAVSGEHATARCEQTIDGKMHSTVEFSLSRATGNWVIQSSK